MTDENIVYSKPSCPSCIKAKTLLDNLNVKYTVKELGKDVSSDELFETFDNLGIPRPRTAPQVFLKGTYVGGYEQLVDYVESTNFNGTGYSNS